MFVCKDNTKIKKAITDETKISNKLHEPACQYDEFVKNKKLEVVDAPNFCIADCIGISEEAELTFYIINQLMLVQVNNGIIFLKDNKDVVSFDSNGKSSKAVDNKNIIWKTTDGINKYFEAFGLDDDKDIIRRQYFANHSFSIMSSYNHSDDSLFVIKAKEIKEM